MIKTPQGVRAANKTLYGLVTWRLPNNAMCATWTLEYGGNSNNWKLKGYDLVKGYGISENMERERSTMCLGSTWLASVTLKETVVGDVKGRTRMISFSVGRFQNLQDNISFRSLGRTFKKLIRFQEYERGKERQPYIDRKMKGTRMK